MDTSLTIQGLVRNLEESLRRKDRQNFEENTGKEPQFPQLVIYLGDDAEKAHLAVSSSLFRLWPQYYRELKFLSVRRDGSEVRFYELRPGGDEAIPISQEGVRGLATALFGTKMHFLDMSKLVAYYILDTTSFLSWEDLDAWLPIIKEVKNLLCIRSSDLLDMLVILLNENHNRWKTAAGIKQRLSAFYDGADVSEAANTVFLLSNRRSDNAILEEWDTCYNIITAIIALSNNSDTKIAASVFRRAVLTASYAKEEKPVYEISRVIVKSVLVELAKNTEQSVPKLINDPSLPERLGMSEKGTLKILDAYAESDPGLELPSVFQLEFFPRRDTGMAVNLASMSDSELNQYTMGSWHQYLRQMAQAAVERIKKNSALRQKWSEEYRKLLEGTFNNEELIYLADHIDDVRELMTKARMPSSGANALGVAGDRLKWLLSGSPELVRLFTDTLEQQGKRAGDFVSAWNNLLLSQKYLHYVRSSNITAFYEKCVRNYFDRNSAGKCVGFRELHDAGELEEFLRGIFDDILDSDEIFSSPFEKELERRLNEEALPKSAMQYIRKKLTGSEVFTYFQGSFSLGNPIMSTVLLKMGTPLYDSLHNNLSPDTYYYNTGSSTAAEAVNIYEISAENLVAEEV